VAPKSAFRRQVMSQLKKTARRRKRSATVNQLKALRKLQVSTPLALKAMRTKMLMRHARRKRRRSRRLRTEAKNLHKSDHSLIMPFTLHYSFACNSVQT